MNPKRSTRIDANMIYKVRLSSILYFAFVGLSGWFSYEATRNYMKECWFSTRMTVFGQLIDLISESGLK